MIESWWDLQEPVSTHRDIDSASGPDKDKKHWSIVLYQITLDFKQHCVLIYLLNYKSALCSLLNVGVYTVDAL